MDQQEGTETLESLTLPLKLYQQPSCSSCLKIMGFVL